MRVMWEQNDITMGLKVKDLNGSECMVVCSSHENSWAIVRLADGYLTPPGDHRQLLQTLNNGYSPEVYSFRALGGRAKG